MLQRSADGVTGSRDLVVAADEDSALCARDVRDRVSRRVEGDGCQRRVNERAEPRTERARRSRGQIDHPHVEIGVQLIEKRRVARNVGRGAHVEGRHGGVGDRGRPLRLPRSIRGESGLDAGLVAVFRDEIVATQADWRRRVEDKLVRIPPHH